MFWQTKAKRDLLYAQQIAQWLYDNHYKHIAVQWEVLDTMSGVLSQIDHMVAVMNRQAASCRGKENIERELDRVKEMYTWAANELLSCDYGDNDTHGTPWQSVGWNVYGWRNRNAQRKIYGASIDAAIDAEIRK